MRVLVVDDQADIRMVIRLSVAQAGRSTEVFEAASGQEAVVLAERHAPDMIVLDVMMPTGSGLDVLPNLRALCPAARILVCSASYDAWTPVPPGADAAIPKDTQFLDRIGESLGRG